MASNILSSKALEISSDRYELRLSGAGGQGMILASVMLAEAIGGSGEKNVIQTQSYGPEARGGASKADIVFSSTEIFYPKAMSLDLLLAMTQQSLDAYLPSLKTDGTLLVDSTYVTDIPRDNYFGLPLTRLAREEMGYVVVSNIIALGAIAELTGIVEREQLLAVVIARSPRGTEDKNRLALDIGYREAAKINNKKPKSGK